MKKVKAVEVENKLPCGFSGKIKVKKSEKIILELYELYLFFLKNKKKSLNIIDKKIIRPKKPISDSISKYKLCG